MRVVPVLLAVALGIASAGCSVTVADINARPDKYYQHKVDFTGRLTRRQDLPAETLLEIADARGSRILVRAPAGVEVLTGQWVRVRGILVPEARVGDATLYDVVTAEKVTRAREPRFAGLM